jgi:hypothetical protein
VLEVPEIKMGGDHMSDFLGKFFENCVSSILLFVYGIKQQQNFGLDV